MTVSDEEFSALQQQVARLTNDLSGTVRTGKGNDDMLNLLLANGLRNLLTGHSYQRLAGGTLQVDNHGLQVLTGGEDIPAIYFVKAFSTNPAVETPRGVYYGNIDDINVDVEMEAVSSVTGMGAVVNVATRDTFATALIGAVKGGKEAQLFFYASDTEQYAELSLDGVTTRLGGGGGMKVQGSGYQTYPAAGVAVPATTKSATANTYGGWTELVAATAQDVYIVGFGFGGVNAVNSYSTISIGVGAAGSEVEIFAIPGGSTAANAFGFNSALAFPVAVPSGSRIAARWQGSSASADPARIHLQYVAQTDLVSL